MQEVSLATVLKAYNFIKKRIQHRSSPVNIPKLLGTEFLQNISSGWAPKWTLWIRFTCFPNLMFLAYPWLKIHRFSNSSFSCLRAVFLIVILLLWKSQNWLYLLILTILGRSIILLSLGKTLGRKKQSKPSVLQKKLKNHAWDLAKVIFNDSISGNQELGSQLNKLQRFNLLFVFVTCFFVICATK